MMNRRSLFKGSAALATVAAGSELASKQAFAAGNGPERVAQRGHDGIMVRYGSLDLESHNDFISGMRKWTNQSSRTAAEARAAEIFNKAGIPVGAELPMAKVMELVGNDPIISMSGYSWMDVQHIKWKQLQNFFHARYDEYLSEMERFDKAGPGSLELNPKMHIPGYCRMEIHQQPGGYVGDPFAGHIYHYATNVTADRKNDQDQAYMTYAALTPLPENKKVKRILDTGTGIGQYATSIKRQFPDAEVWGIDVGGPMLRYAHMRAVDMGVAVNFRQVLAEDTGFPDNHFDLVISHLMHHEVTADALRAIFKENQRILRPGGHYFAIDSYTNGPAAKDAMGQFDLFWTYRWNHEDWQIEWAEVDQAGDMKKAGYKVWYNEPGPSTGRRNVFRRGYNNIVGTKV